LIEISHRIVGKPFSATGHFRVGCVADPDKEVIENIMKFGKRVADLAKKLYHSSCFPNIH
jgi:hypothetical protein